MNKKEEGPGPRNKEGAPKTGRGRRPRLADCCSQRKTLRQKTAPRTRHKPEEKTWNPNMRKTLARRSKAGKEESGRMEERDKDRGGLRKPKEEQGRRQEGEGNQQTKSQGRTEKEGRGATDHRNETDDRGPEDEPKPRGTCGPLNRRSGTTKPCGLQRR